MTIAKRPQRNQSESEETVAEKFILSAGKGARSGSNRRSFQPAGADHDPV